MKLQKETHIQALLVRQTIKQIERAKQRLEMQRKELLRLEDECSLEIKADFEKGAFWVVEIKEQDNIDFAKDQINEQIEESIFVEARIKTESGYLIDFTYWFIDGEIFDGEDKSIEAWSFHVEIEDEEVFINIEPSDVNKLLVKYYKH